MARVTLGLLVACLTNTFFSRSLDFFQNFTHWLSHESTRDLEKNVGP